MQSLTFKSMDRMYGLVDHPILEITDLIRWYESRGYRYRHKSVRAGYVPKMTPGNCIVANYSGRFGKGLQIAEGKDACRVTVHYLIRKGGKEDAKAQAAPALGDNSGSCGDESPESDGLDQELRHEADQS